MTAIDELDLPALEPPAPAPAPSSVLNDLRAKYQRHSAARTYDMVVPGTDDRLALRLGAIDAARWEKIIDLINSGRRIEASCDMIIAGFRQALHRENPEAELRTITVDGDENPIGLRQLVDILVGSSDERSARQGVQLLFSQAADPVPAMMAATGRYQEWAQDADAATADAFLGE